MYTYKQIIIFMGILTWILLGGIAGWLASIIMRTRASQGILLNVVIGIIGAFIGGLVFDVLGGAGEVSGFNLYSLVVATVGAVLFIGIVRLLRGH